MRSSMDEAFPLTELDLLDRDAGRRFLDFYGDEGLALAFERYGVTGAILAKGWEETRLETQAVDDRHTLLIDARHGDAWERVVELVVRRDRLVVEGLDAVFDVLTADWVLLQSPGARFTPARPRLPGQEHPGLGVGERILEMLYVTARRLRLDALVTTAEYLHNAILYGRELKYVDPRYEGQLLALEALLLEREDLTLAQASWAMEWGFVLDESDRTVSWRGEAMARAQDERLKDYVTSRAHAEHAAQHRDAFRYRLHREAFDERWAKERAALQGESDDPRDPGHP